MSSIASAPPQAATHPPIGNLNFDPRTLRLFVGVLAFSLPIVARIFAQQTPTSISASYHTTEMARNVFVGSVSVIGVLLMAYQGHKPDPEQARVGIFWNIAGGLLNLVRRLWGGKTDYRIWGRVNEEDLISWGGGLGAVAAALFPTTCDTCATDARSVIHYIGAILLFSTVVYYCLYAFRRAVTLKLGFADSLWYFMRHARKAGPAHRLKVRRGFVYIFCGWLIGAIMLSLVAVQITFPELAKALRITYWAEFAAMLLFGLAWVVASLLRFRDPDELEVIKSRRVAVAKDILEEQAAA